MTNQQVLAFNHASGTTSNELLTAIVTMLFVIAMFWVVIMMVGKLRSLTHEHDVDVGHIALSSIRVLGVVVMILFLVNI